MAPAEWQLGFAVGSVLLFVILAWSVIRIAWNTSRANEKLDSVIRLLQADRDRS